MKLQKIILSIAIIIIPFTSFADKTTATIQRNLNLLGYNAGPVDGAYGKKTRLALEQFYKDNGGLFDGKTDDNEIIDLTKALALNSGCNSSDLYETTSEISDKKFSLFGSKVRNTIIPKYLKNTTGEITSDIGNVYAHIQLVDDFNNDGIDDLLIDYNSTLVAPLILYGQKSGSFKILDLGNSNSNAARKTIRKAVSADFNNDGFLDIFGFTTGDHYQEKDVSEVDLLLINQNGNTFKAVDIPEPRKNSPNHGGFVIDINNDGYTDIVSLDEEEGFATYPLKNIEGKKFSLLKKGLNPDVKKYRIHDGDAGDLNNDGFQDMVISIHLPKKDKFKNKENLRIIYGDGDFNFDNNKITKTGNSWLSKKRVKEISDDFDAEVLSGTSNINLVDINADGKIDILVGEYIDAFDWKTSGFKSYINLGNCFADQTSTYFPNQKANRKMENGNFTDFIGAFEHADLNNDGFKDLILRNWMDETAYWETAKAEAFPYIFMNHNNKKYLPISFRSMKRLRDEKSLSVGDFNGDGLVDLVTIGNRFESNEITVRTFLLNAQ
jgi:hypothetical protein